MQSFQRTATAGVLPVLLGGNNGPWLCKGQCQGKRSVHATVDSAVGTPSIAECAALAGLVSSVGCALLMDRTLPSNSTVEGGGRGVGEWMDGCVMVCGSAVRSLAGANPGGLQIDRVTLGWARRTRTEKSLLWAFLLSNLARRQYEAAWRHVGRPAQRPCRAHIPLRHADCRAVLGPECRCAADKGGLAHPSRSGFSEWKVVLIFAHLAGKGWRLVPPVDVAVGVRGGSTTCKKGKNSG